MGKGRERREGGRGGWGYRRGSAAVPFCSVQNIKPDQMNVKHQLWRGRVHSTMAKDPNGDITMTSLPKSVFSDWNVGDSVKAKVICINERHVQK